MILQGTESLNQPLTQCWYFNNFLMQLVLIIFGNYCFFLFRLLGRCVGLQLFVGALLTGSSSSDFILSIINLMRLCSPNDASRYSLKDGNCHSLCLEIFYWVCGTWGRGEWVVSAVCYAPNSSESVTSFCGVTIHMLPRWDQMALFVVWSILSPYIFLAGKFFQIQTPMLQLNSCGHTPKSKQPAELCECTKGLS